MQGKPDCGSPARLSFATSTTSICATAPCAGTSFPIHLEKVSGFLDIYPGKWVFHDGPRPASRRRGRRSRAMSRAVGDKGRGEDDGLELKITGGRSPWMTRTCAGPLAPMPHLARPWESFRPRGRINFGARVDLPPGRPQDVDVLVNVNGAAIEPQFFPYLDQRHQRPVSLPRESPRTVRQVEARHNDATLDHEPRHGGPACRAAGITRSSRSAHQAAPGG